MAGEVGAHLLADQLAQFRSGREIKITSECRIGTQLGRQQGIPGNRQRLRGHRCKDAGRCAHPMCLERRRTAPEDSEAPEGPTGAARF